MSQIMIYKIIRMIILVNFIFVISGCAGVGIVASSDPDVKLKDAEYLLFKADRPFPAERLISEAIELYKKQNNMRGLALAYADYGDLLSSDTLTKWGRQNMKFQDPTVTFNNRFEKSKEYYEVAIDTYLGAANQAKANNQFDALTNIYLNMARIYFELKNIDKTCDLFDKSYIAYKENIKLNPGVIAIGYNSTPELIESRKRNVGCK